MTIARLVSVLTLSAALPFSLPGQTDRGVIADDDRVGDVSGC